MSDNKIDWQSIEQPTRGVTMTLGSVTIDQPHVVTFHKVTQTANGGIVAEVECETLEGDTLWLRSPQWGNQNGLLSLIKCAQGGENIEGGSFTFTRIESEKSPAGFAYRWTQ